MIVQWGQVDAVMYEGEQIVTLPTPFPNAVRFAIAIPLNTTSNGECDVFAQLQSASGTHIKFYFSFATSSVPANGFQWLSLGY
ncbi:gp53-like domain-containing protein [Escherichia coli]|uniref:gp53-like domain-containing protein n=1 Tax=Escherichia coli TaxID=562 RepID=UPI003D31D62F